MKIETEERGDKLLVRLNGRFVDIVCDDVIDTVMAKIKPHIKDIIMNLEGVEYLSSSGLGTIVRLHRNTSEMSKRLILAGPNENVNKVLEISNMGELVPIYPAEEEALKEL